MRFVIYDLGCYDPFVIASCCTNIGHAYFHIIYLFIYLNYKFLLASQMDTPYKVLPYNGRSELCGRGFRQNMLDFVIIRTSFAKRVDTRTVNTPRT